MTYLLDTDHASVLLSPRHPLWTRMHQTIAEGHRFVIIADVVAEVQFGIEATRDPQLRKIREDNLDGLLQTVAAEPVDVETAREGGRLRGRLRRQGRQVSLVDANLAAAGLLQGGVLLSGDGDFVPLAPDVAIENWLP